MQHTSKKHLIGTVAGAVVIAAVFFFIGRASAKPHMPPSPFGGQGGGMAQNGSMRRSAGSGAMGTVLSFDANSITLGIRGGGSKIVLISPSTQILKSAPGTQSDLTNGTSVIVNGTPNADGSISASTVSVRPTDPQAGTPAAPKNP